MSHPRRNLRSNTSTAPQPSAPPPTSSHPSPRSLPANPSSPIKQIPPHSTLPSLTPRELSLLRLKQRTLTHSAPTTLASLPPTSPLIPTLKATFIFAQHEAGTAICIHPAGWVLTCAHCFGDTEAEYRRAREKGAWMLRSDGVAVRTECRVWDEKRDLALARIVAVETDSLPPNFEFVHTSARLSQDVKLGTEIVCIGQPGADDLESSTQRKTTYHLLEISEGAFRGMVAGRDPNENGEMGTLMHDAWTYWGHSGAPLVRGSDGVLVGLHSSWDEKTGMRRGVPREAVVGFLEEWVPGMGESGGEWLGRLV